MTLVKQLPYNSCFTVNHSVDEQKINDLIILLNEKEILLKERELALEEQQEEYLSQKEELAAAVEELISKNEFLTKTLEKLKQRNQELDHILYRASHDFKTPVSSIRGLVDILNSGNLNADQQTATTHISEQVKQMQIRLSSLTNLSTAFFNEPQLQECSLCELISKIWKQLNVRHTTRLLIPSEDVRIVTDVALLSVAVKCILENAIAYRDPAVSGYVKIKCLKEDSVVHIDVYDDGDGISPDIAPHIFKMFYRGSEKSKGFGLGLYIAANIMEKLNGRIQHLPLNKETLFRITLPA